MGGQMGAGSKAPCPRLAPWAPCVSHGAFCGPGGKAAGPGAGLPGVENLFSAPGSPAGARKAGIAKQSRPFAQGGCGGCSAPPTVLTGPARSVRNRRTGRCCAEHIRRTGAVRKGCTRAWNEDRPAFRTSHIPSFGNHLPIQAVSPGRMLLCAGLFQFFPF